MTLLNQALAEDCLALGMLSLFMVVFLLLSVTISFVPWPIRFHRLGMWLASLSLLLSAWLSWQLLSVSGSWFALTQKLELLAHDGQLLLPTLAGLVSFLAVVGNLGVPNLNHELGVALVYLFLYLLLKVCSLAFLYLWGRFRQGGLGIRRERYQGHSAAVLLPALLALPLSLLPLLEDMMPESRLLFTLPLWVACWIMLLELRLWLAHRDGN